MLALAGLGWVVAWLWSQPLVAAPVGIGAAAGLLISRRRPRLAAGVVLAAGAAAAAVGVPAENPAMLLPCAVVVYGLGRWAGSSAAICGLVGFVVPVAWSDHLSVPTLVFGIFLYAVFWGFGRLVAAKTARAAGARAVAVRVGARDPQQVAAAVVVEERSRLAADVTQVVGASVQKMLIEAEQAEADLSPARIERIRQCGTTGMTELRRLLGLLREAPAVAPPPTSGRGRVPIAASATAAVLAVATAIEYVVAEPPAQPAVLVLLGVLPVTIVLCRRRTVEALLAAVGMLVLVGLVQPTALRLGPALVLVLLSWSAAVCGRRSAWTSWLLLAAVAIGVDAAAEPDNVAMLAVLMALAAWAGHAWSEFDRSEQVARDSAATARSALETAVVAALQAERLRIARDLHDMTSHALGVMVLQAGAAAAQHAHDPDRARASLAVIRQTGLLASTDLARLTGLIDAGALRADLPAGVRRGVDQPDPFRLTDRLAALADRMRTAGLDVTLRCRPPDLHAAVVDVPGGAARSDQTVSTAIYRVVQEAITNVVRHAPGARVEVCVEADEGGCRLSVCDDGGQGPASPGAGFGLVGAAERVRSIGGELTAGPQRDGGWRVEATIPEPLIPEPSIREPLTPEPLIPEPLIPEPSTRGINPARTGGAAS